MDTPNYESVGSRPTVGFIGVGAIGAPMAQRVLEQHKVVVFDPNPAQVETMVQAGASSAASVAEVADCVQVAVIMVATPQQLDRALFGPGGLTAASSLPSTVIVMSSVGIEAVRSAAQTLTGHAVAVVDAPVTGGVVRAVTGELTLLVGGREEDITPVLPVLQLMGSRIARCGERVGDGQAVKLVNQLLCSVHLAVAGEALNFAATLGLDPAQVLDIVGSGAAASFMLHDRGPRMLTSSDAPVLSAVDIFVKDSGLVADAARAGGADVPLLLAAAERFQAASAAGFGREDDSSVIRAY